MVNSNVSVAVDRLSKRYRLGVGVQVQGRLTEALAGSIRSTWRRWSSRTASDGPSRELWALRDVSFDVRHGDVLGIIGRNGAGKTTLLKILSRITEPTEGRAELHGRVGALLEIGTGFHPDLTGRENVFLNGAILGMGRREIQNKFQEIVDFSEIGDFLDTPVKRYSSGMQVRLAFAIAAHLEPDILLVDEVLAVGDAGFQRKCLARLGAVATEGRTVLFVSHNMGAIAELCSSALLLDEGRLVTSGATEEVIRTYLRGFAENEHRIERPAVYSGASVTSVQVLDSELNPSAELDFRDPFYIAVEFEVSRRIRALSAWMRLVNDYGVNVLFSWIALDQSYGPGQYRAVARLPQALLAPGHYYVDVGVEHYRIEKFHYAYRCKSFEILNTSATFDSDHSGWGVIHPKLAWDTAALPKTSSSGNVGSLG
jgi:lipopolysaccharide transport system ATP-binding protein